MDFKQTCRDCGELFPWDADSDRCPNCVADTLGEPFPGYSVNVNAGLPPDGDIGE